MNKLLSFRFHCLGVEKYKELKNAGWDFAGNAVNIIWFPIRTDRDIWQE